MDATTRILSARPANVPERAGTDPDLDRCPTLGSLEEATVAKPFRPRTARQALLLLALLIVLAGVLAGLLNRAGR